MEQKQLDEVEDSFFGEEFVDDEDLLEEVKEEVTVEPARKEVSEKTVESGADETEKVKSPVEKEKKEKKSSSSKKTKATKKTATKVSEKESKDKKEEKMEEKDVEKDIEIKPAKDNSSIPPKDPWHEGNDDAGLFKEVSTWKAITGIVVILLIFSIFTQGFKFSEGITSSVVGIPLGEAETKSLDYVNNNLLTGAPFIAELYSAEELDSVYKVTFAISGETIDSYITKDGKLFFPQGFDTAKSLEDQLGITDVTAGSQLEEAQEENEAVVENGEPELGNVVEGGETGIIGENVIIPIVAKKWLFQPNLISINKGNTVQLVIAPQGLEFTLSIPELGIEKEVSGQTVIEFVADKAGKFEFSCSSCEEFRGMTGMLIVE